MQEAHCRRNEGSAARGLQNQLRCLWCVLDVRLQLRIAHKAQMAC